MQQVNDTTFQTPELGDVKPVVTIGGDDTRKFIPNINNSFHDDEFFFNLNCVDDIVTDEKAQESNGVISQSVNGEKHEYYIDESGRLKWDKLFSACPDSMRVRFKVRKSAGIKFEYQPELTAEEIADGCERPDDIVGSYAVYCDKANNKYKTGKLCHIPRPFVIDASGNKKWCVMTYEEIRDTEGMLYIDMPEEFMQSAVYPVRLDPTIGYTTQGDSVWTRTNELALYSLINNTAISDGTSNGIYCYLTSGFDRAIQLGYYNSSAERVAYGTINSGWLTGWNNIALAGYTISSGSDYHITFCVGDYGTGNGGIAYDDYTDACYYSTATSLPATWTSTNYYPRRYSLYLEYTASGGSTGHPAASRLRNISRNPYVRYN